MRIREYSNEYLKGLATNWDKQLTILSTITIAKTQQQAAYSAFVNGFKNKLKYFMRTTSTIYNCLFSKEQSKMSKNEQQSLQYNIHEDNLKKLKTNIKKSKEENYKKIIERITTEMNDKEKHLSLLK